MRLVPTTPGPDELGPAETWRMPPNDIRREEPPRTGSPLDEVETGRPLWVEEGAIEERGRPIPILDREEATGAGTTAGVGAGAAESVYQYPHTLRGIQISRRCAHT